MTIVGVKDSIFGTALRTFKFQLFVTQPQNREELKFANLQCSGKFDVVFYKDVYS